MINGKNTTKRKQLPVKCFPYIYPVQPSLSLVPQLIAQFLLLFLCIPQQPSREK